MVKGKYRLYIFEVVYNYIYINHFWTYEIHTRRKNLVLFIVSVGPLFREKQQELII